MNDAGAQQAERAGVEVTDAQIALARTALAEIAPAEVIGDLVAVTAEADAVSLQFECLVAGYPHWLWTASLSDVPGQDPQTVLETELMPGEGALVAPEWVPWSERLAEYRANQRREAEDAEASDSDEPDEAPSAGTLDEDSDDDIADPRDEADDLDEIFDGVDFEADDGHDADDSNDDDSEDDDSDVDDSDDD